MTILFLVIYPLNQKNLRSSFNVFSNSVRQLEVLLRTKGNISEGGQRPVFKIVPMFKDQILQF